jgi:hypothetical protein
VPINEIESHRRCRPAEPARGGGDPTASPPRPSTIVVVHKAPRLDWAIHRSQRRNQQRPTGPRNQLAAGFDHHRETDERRHSR